MADKIPYNPMPQKTTASSLVYISFYFHKFDIKQEYIFLAVVKLLYQIFLSMTQSYSSL